MVYYIYKSIVRTNDATRKKHLRLVHYQPQRQILGDVSMIQKMLILLVATATIFLMISFFQLLVMSINSSFPAAKYNNIYPVLKITFKKQYDGCLDCELFIYRIVTGRKM